MVAVLDRSSLAELPLAAAGEDRLRRIFDEEFDLVWRYLRRLGLGPADADDGAQQVFVIAARKLDCIMPGKERAFLCGTAYKVAADIRRKTTRRREVADEAIGELAEPGLRPDDVAEQRRARALLDQALDALPAELRSVFVLFELEELTTPQIADALELPVGTVASRLRRARESFRDIVKRLRAGGLIPGEIL